jgi:hypothetical protein
MDVLVVDIKSYALLDSSSVLRPCVVLNRTQTALILFERQLLKFDRTYFMIQDKIIQCCTFS